MNVRKNCASNYQTYNPIKFIVGLALNIDDDDDDDDYNRCFIIFMVCFCLSLFFFLFIYSTVYITVQPIANV